MTQGDNDASPNVTDIAGVRLHVPRAGAADFVAQHGAPDPGTLPERYRQSPPVDLAAGPGSGIPACPATMRGNGIWCLVDETKTTCIYEQCGS